MGREPGARHSHGFVRKAAVRLPQTQPRNGVASVKDREVGGRTGGSP